MISGKLQKNNFRIIYFDGNYTDITLLKKELPPKIVNHRPDVVGEKENGVFCIGEAKTKNDLNSLRTKNQLLDFLSFVSINTGNRLIIGIPISAETILNRILIGLNIKDHSQLEIILVPDILLPKQEDEEN